MTDHFCFTIYTKRKMFTIEIKDGREAPCKYCIKYFGKVKNQQKTAWAK